MGRQRRAQAVRLTIVAALAAAGISVANLSAGRAATFTDVRDTNGAVQTGHGEGDLFDEIYERGRPMEQSLTTIHARFTEETTSSLLTTPLTAEGTLLVVRPSDILLVYTKPERKTLRLDAGRLTFEWPDRGLRDAKDIRESQARVQKYFLNKSPDELRKHFTIAAAVDRARPGTWRIEMVPRRKQIQQGLSRLELWLRQDTTMLSAMRMSFPGGDTKTMTFTDVVLNQPVSDDEIKTAGRPIAPR